MSRPHPWKFHVSKDGMSVDISILNKVLPLDASDDQFESP